MGEKDGSRGGVWRGRKKVSGDARDEAAKGLIPDLREVLMGIRRESFLLGNLSLSYLTRLRMGNSVVRVWRLL